METATARPTLTAPGPDRLRGRALWLIGMVALQAFAALFFAVDLVMDFIEEVSTGLGLLHTALEALAVLGLIVGIGFGWREVRALQSREARLAARIGRAAREFHDLLDTYFTDWGLTPSERDVALLSIKGLSVGDIATARGSAQGTVKAQLSAIYAKAGVTGRPQLLSLLLDDLMGARPPDA